LHSTYAAFILGSYGCGIAQAASRAYPICLQNELVLLYEGDGIIYFQLMQLLIRF
jgi:hypothetical protein